MQELHAKKIRPVIKFLTLPSLDRGGYACQVQLSSDIPIHGQRLHKSSAVDKELPKTYLYVYLYVNIQYQVNFCNDLLYNWSFGYDGLLIRLLRVREGEHALWGWLGQVMLAMIRWTVIWRTGSRRTVIIGETTWGKPSLGELAFSLNIHISTSSGTTPTKKKSPFFQKVQFRAPKKGRLKWKREISGVKPKKGNF